MRSEIDYYPTLNISHLQSCIQFNRVSYSEMRMHHTSKSNIDFKLPRVYVRALDCWLSHVLFCFHTNCCFVFISINWKNKKTKQKNDFCFLFRKPKVVTSTDPIGDGFAARAQEEQRLIRLKVHSIYHIEWINYLFITSFCSIKILKSMKNYNEWKIKTYYIIGKKIIVLVNNNYVENVWLKAKVCVVLLELIKLASIRLYI